MSLEPYYEDQHVAIYHDKWEAVFMALDRCDHVITDPPYSEHTHKKQWIGAALTDKGKPRVGIAHTELGFEPITGLEAEQFAASIRVQCRRWAAVFCDLESISMWKAAIQRSDLDYVRACIWDKVDSAPQFTGDRPAAAAEAFVLAHPAGRKKWNGGGGRNVYRYPVNGRERGPKIHPAQKPESLMRAIISNFTDPGELIVDPYMGAGTTLRVAKDLGRKAIGIEISERWCEAAARRMEQGVLDLYRSDEEFRAETQGAFFDEGGGSNESV
ncbi:MAG: site-specific DNA-methyltransferase [bacterium]|nr:site-specific DNA-methyltransferase [bacterium]